jgi:arylsulfatase A
MVTYMDKMVGRIVEKLEALGLREDTLILFTGDNGTDKPIVSEINGQRVAGGKGATTDAGTRVPLIVSWPRQINLGRVSLDLVDFSDFFPTLCQIADTAVPSELKIDGRSFLPQILGKTGNPRDWIYCWFSRDGATDLAKEFSRNQRYKLYRTGEFYDIQKDVLEEHDLQNTELDPQTSRIAMSLQEVLNWYKDARPPELRVS